MHTSNGQFHNLLLFSFVAESNASLSGSEASEEFDANSEKFELCKFINGEEYKFVVSVGAFEDEERKILSHKCLANMVSLWNAISSAYCVEKWYVHKYFMTKVI